MPLGVAINSMEDKTIPSVDTVPVGRSGHGIETKSVNTVRRDRQVAFFNTTNKFPGFFLFEVGSRIDVTPALNFAPHPHSDKSCPQRTTVGRSAVTGGVGASHNNLNLG